MRYREFSCGLPISREGSCSSSSTSQSHNRSEWHLYAVQRIFWLSAHQQGEEQQPLIYRSVSQPVWAIQAERHLYAVHCSRVQWCPLDQFSCCPPFRMAGTVYCSTARTLAEVSLVRDYSYMSDAAGIFCYWLLTYEQWLRVEQGPPLLSQTLTHLQMRDIWKWYSRPCSTCDHLHLVPIPN